MKNTARLDKQEMSRMAALASQLSNQKNIGWVPALELAQCELFPQSKWYTKSSLYQMSNKFREAIPKDNEIVVQQTVTKPVEQPVAVETQPVAVQEASPGLERFTFGNKISELVSCLAKQFEDQLSAELETALNAALGNVERSFAKKLDDARKIAGITRKQLPRVMVIGVMGEVAFQTESEYGEMLDLRFYKQEENLSLIRAQVKHCDYVVLIVGHINHGHQDCVRNHPGLIFCNGGVTQMKEILLNLACK